MANELCALCGAFPETMVHTQCDYSIAKELWKSVGNCFIKDSFFSTNFDDLVGRQYP